MTVEELRKKLEHFAPGKRVFLQVKNPGAKPSDGKPVETIKDREQDGEEVVVLQ